ncbi:MAG: hypothetical protein UFP36_08355 [Collinsella sp.]|nr:hypothetical protein [Collinsella sp.]
MIETENKVYARRCESHVEALRRAVPGCIEKVEWQCEDQLTITVKQDKLPEASTTCTTSATAGFP